MYGQKKILELIWVDSQVNNDENNSYKEEIKKIKEVNFICFENVPLAMEYIKKLEFIPIFIIISGRLYPEFIKEFKRNCNEISILPKIIIFCGDAESYIERNKNNLDLSINHPFFNFGGVKDDFDDVKDLILKENSISIESTSFENIYSFQDKFIFEYISEPNQLIVPLYLSKYMKKPDEKEIHNFNQLYLDHYFNVSELTPLFTELVECTKIPYEFLYKYWLKAYSLENNFYDEVNEELKNSQFYEYLVFVQVMYEGIKESRLTKVMQNYEYLYRYSSLTKDKLESMNNIISKKKENLPSIILYSKSFLSFYLNINEATKFNSNIDNNNILLIIENAEDILKQGNEYISLSEYNPNKINQIIIFPFYFFEVLKIEKKDEKIYKIYLGSLEKYKELFKEDPKLLAAKIPESSSITTDFFIKYNLIDDEYKDMYNIITIKYKINSFVKFFTLFGEEFVEKNKDKCFMIYNGKKLEIQKEFSLTDEDKELKEFEFKLFGLNKIEDISHLFDKAKYLVGLPDISKLNTENITNMSCMFKNCSNLQSLPDISKWNTSKVTNMSYLFAKCSSLKEIPNISKWDTSNVTDMSYMFDSCDSLTSLPDVSMWKTSKVTCMNYMFHDLSNLESFPDISNWDTNSVKEMISLFEKCSLITSLPDISGWNTGNLIDVSFMFYMCKSLNSLPDISKWESSNITKVDNMFFGLKKSITIPEKFKK